MPIYESDQGYLNRWIPIVESSEEMGVRKNLSITNCELSLSAPRLVSRANARLSNSLEPNRSSASKRKTARPPHRARPHVAAMLAE